MSQNGDLDKLDWSKADGLLPAVIQHWQDGRVLMLGYMNAAALERTRARGVVCFYSRSKGRLWTKGESSGHFLAVRQIHADCDSDAVLVLAEPAGPTCHLQTESCFGETARPGLATLFELDALIEQRRSRDPATSYTARLFASGPKRIAQKVGEEGVETALAAVQGSDAELAGEAADLLYHLLVLLRSRKLGLADAIKVLDNRRN